MAKPEPAWSLVRCAQTAERGASAEAEHCLSRSASVSGTVGDLFCSPLFSNSPQPVLIVDTARWLIVHVNVAAARMLGRRRAALVGVPLLDFLRSGSGPDMCSLLTNARLDGSARLTDVRVVANGDVLNATVSLVKSGGREYLLLHPERRTDGAGSLEVQSLVTEAIDRAAVGFLVTDDRLQVLYANRAFVGMAGLVSADESIGRSLRRWLKLSSHELTKLCEQMTARESVTGFVTSLTGEDQSSRRVHVLAIAVPDGSQPRWGFTLTEHASIN